jgi:hypothetical protein
VSEKLLYLNSIASIGPKMRKYSRLVANRKVVHLLDQRDCLTLHLPAVAFSIRLVLADCHSHVNLNHLPRIQTPRTYTNQVKIRISSRIYSKDLVARLYPVVDNSHVFP